MRHAQDAGRTEDEILALIKSRKPKARNKKGNHRKTREQAAGNKTDGHGLNTEALIDRRLSTGEGATLLTHEGKTSKQHRK